MTRKLGLLLAATAALALAGGTSAAPAAGCRNVPVPKPKANGTLHGPSTASRLSRSLVYRVTIQTNCGSFTITVDQRTSPHLAYSFVDLVRRHFYDGTVFHRIVPGFVIQGGDPTGTGTGGPGYSTVDPPPRSARYVFGVVAMAKTQAEAPGTSGSQFFVVTGKDVGLPPDYALLGRVTSGAAVVRLIGTLGDPQTQRPTRPVVIGRVTVATASR